MSYRELWATHYYGAMRYALLSISTHLYELLSLAIQCYGHYALLRSMDRVDTFPDVVRYANVRLQEYVRAREELLTGPQGGTDLRWMWASEWARYKVRTG